MLRRSKGFALRRRQSYDLQEPISKFATVNSTKPPRHHQYYNCDISEDKLPTLEHCTSDTTREQAPRSQMASNLHCHHGAFNYLGRAPRGPEAMKRHEVSAVSGRGYLSLGSIPNQQSKCIEKAESIRNGDKNAKYSRTLGGVYAAAIPLSSFPWQDGIILVLAYMGLT